MLKRIKITAEGVGLGEKPEPPAKCKIVWKGQYLARKFMKNFIHSVSIFLQTLTLKLFKWLPPTTQFLSKIKGARRSILSSQFHWLPADNNSDFLIIRYKTFETVNLKFLITLSFYVQTKLGLRIGGEEFRYGF